MIYGKLPVAFLGAIASEKKGATNSAIASFILENLKTVRGMNITELADVCHVSASTISRFCKETGFDSYAELREVLETSQMAFEQGVPAATARERAEKTAGNIAHAIAAVQQTLDYGKLRKLCMEISKYGHVAAFGLLKAEAAAVNLQCDFLMLGKQIYTNVSYTQQMEYLLSANDDDLILIFSYTGAYFDYQDLRAFQERLRKPRIWMIAGEEKVWPPFVDETLLFSSCHGQAGHPYQLQTMASLIAGEYALMQNSMFDTNADS